MRVFADNDLSAARDGVEREAYEALREAIRRGEVAHLWAVEQSRLERREVQWFILAAELDAAGIDELHTSRDGIVKVRDEVAGIKAVLNAGEVRKLKQRVNDTLAARAAEGRPAGVTPFGYERARDADGGKTYRIVPAQAAEIRKAADRVLAGWSLANIAADMRARGVIGAHGGQINRNTVRSMLVRPTVAGYRVHRGEIVGHGVWEPILDEDTWQAVRLKLSQPRRVKTSDGGDYAVTAAGMASNTGRRYLLTGGLIRCGVCGAPVIGTRRHRATPPGRPKPEPKPYLTCHPNRGGKACVGIVLEPAEQHVVDTLFAELDRPEFLDAIAADEHGQRRDEITTALQAVERQRAELAAMWSRPGELTTAEWQAARQGLADQEQQLRRELAELPPPVVNVDIAAARQAWPAMTLDEQREFLRLFIARITLHPAKVRGRKAFDPSRIEIEWRPR